MMLVGAGFIVAGAALHMAMWLSKGDAGNVTRRDGTDVRDHTERRDTQPLRTF